MAPAVIQNWGGPTEREPNMNILELRNTLFLCFDTIVETICFVVIEHVLYVLGSGAQAQRGARGPGNKQDTISGLL